MDDERLDLSALDPTRDAMRFARARAAIAAGAAAGLRRRRTRGDVWGVLSAWRQPVLAAAGVVMLMSAFVLLRAPTVTRTAAVTRATGTQAGALSPSQTLLASSGAPTALWSAGGASDPGELLEPTR